MNPVVHIISFGFHRSGPPDDPTGNGGGFVFDCRLLPNPGRHEDLAGQTGLDEAVSSMLAARPETAAFLGHVEAIVQQAVRQYGEWGYENLQVAFGCTGGRHRSVYCAEQLAATMREQGVSVRVDHRERETWT